MPSRRYRLKLEKFTLHNEAVRNFKQILNVIKFKNLKIVSLKIKFGPKFENKVPTTRFEKN